MAPHASSQPTSSTRRDETPDTTDLERRLEAFLLIARRIGLA